MNDRAWPKLDAERDSPTFAVLHLAAQMLGKIRIAHAPWANHGWHAALQPRSNGLETLPTASGDGRTFTLVLDLCRHAIVLWVSDESREELPLNAGTISALHSRLVAMLERNGLPSTFKGRQSEIEEAVQAHANIAEVAVVGVADPVKGQMPLAFAVVKDASMISTPEARSRHEREVMDTVDRQLGPVGRPARVHFVSLLPKTRSGKIMRRLLRDIAEGKALGDTTTLADPTVVARLKDQYESQE